MGYTHYWYIADEISQDSWDKFLGDFRTILPEFKNILDIQGDQKLEHDKDVIFLNGIGELAHESFLLERVTDITGFTQRDEDNGLIFKFCKTAQKPYDIAVCSALIIAKKHFGESIRISSDGENHDWQEAKTLCENTLGYGEYLNMDYSPPVGEFTE
ncbi:MAG: hypothetical protein HOI55_14700 [Candidatus Marinimicrobia bacterium]|nr:hypothetical protein [Candidatus Neomarinimicrobiota bacterium]